jgi:hypothetical protein
MLEVMQGQVQVQVRLVEEEAVALQLLVQMEPVAVVVMVEMERM